MSQDRESHDWARNRGLRILGIDPDRRRNQADSAGRRERPATPAAPGEGEFAEPPTVDRSGGPAADPRN